MFLEGQVNWAWVLGLAAAAGWAIALVALWFAVSHRSRHVDTSGQLDLVQRVADDSRKRLFEILNAIPVALVETDRQGKFVFANRAAHQLLGRRNAELLGLRFHSATWGITYPDGRPVPPDLLPSARALRGQTVRGFRHLIVNPASRRKLLVSVTAMPIEDEWGQTIGSTAALVETDGLQAPEVTLPEPAGALSGDLTRRVFDAAASALVVVGPDGRVRDANRTALLVAGRDGVVDADFVDLFLAEGERAEARERLRAALSSPSEDAGAIVSNRTPEAGVRWSILPLADGDGRTDALLLAGERAEPDEAADLRAEVEAAHAAARKAAVEAEVRLQGGRRMETVGRLTGGLAHDFNALLGVLTGALDMMLRQADDPARVRRIGEAALVAGRKGEGLTRRLTAFSQGDDEPVLRTLDAGVLLRGLETRLRALAGPDVDLMIEAAPDAAPVRLDPVAFEGAVRALTQNAVEAVAGRGSIAVRLEALADGGVRLGVRDDGPGMDRELAARAPEPFFTTRDGAAGLGLSQAYAFARQSGGMLSIDSEPGAGAEVSIRLPPAPEA